MTMGLRLLTATIVILVVVTAGHVAAGQLSEQSRPAQAPPLFTVESALVVLHVTVKDKKGSYVTNLSQDAFGVVEDGQPQTIRVFTREDAPATVGLLIDSSGSMQTARALVIAAAGAFVETSTPQDEIFALAFSDDVRAALPPAAPFTNDSATLRAALTRTFVARGRTALYDAVDGGLDYLAKGSHERKALVVVSDGGDNASASPFEQVLTNTQTSNAVVYTVGLVDPLERDANPKRLRQLAEASGGESFFPHDATHVADVLRHIARDIRNTYTLGYVSTNTARDGRFRRVRVVVNGPDRRTVVVRTRSGYRAGRATDRSE